MRERDPLPFATATIARLYMLQGKLDQSEAIYRRLLEENPGERRLEEGLAEVRRRAEARTAPLGDDRLELRREGATLRCRYAITPEGRRRAGLLLAGDGALILRIMTFPARAGTAPKDASLTEAAGELSLSVADEARVVAAAVGLLDGERFVAITHACTAA